MIVLIEPLAVLRCPHLTARQMIHSGLIGLWRDREDSAAYACQLREQAQRRRAKSISCSKT